MLFKRQGCFSHGDWNGRGVALSPRMSNSRGQAEWNATEQKQTQTQKPDQTWQLHKAPAWLTFLLRGAIARTSVGHQLGVIGKGVAQHTATPVDIAGAGAADDGARGLVGGRVGVLLAVGVRPFGVVELLRGGDGGEAVDQLEVELEYFCAVDAVLGGIVEREGRVRVVAVLWEVLFFGGLAGYAVPRSHAGGERMAGLECRRISRQMLTESSTGFRSAG